MARDIPASHDADASPAACPPRRPPRPDGHPPRDPRGAALPHPPGPSTGSAPKTGKTTIWGGRWSYYWKVSWITKYISGRGAVHPSVRPPPPPTPGQAKPGAAPTGNNLHHSRSMRESGSQGRSQVNFLWQKHIIFSAICPDVSHFLISYSTAAAGDNKRRPAGSNPP